MTIEITISTYRVSFSLLANVLILFFFFMQAEIFARSSLGNVRTFVGACLIFFTNFTFLFLELLELVFKYILSYNGFQMPSHG